MILRYGTYALQADSSTVEIAKERIISDSGFAVGVSQTWTCKIRLSADTLSALSTLIINTELAFGVNGRDLRLLFNDGTATAHHLPNAGSVNGVIVKSLNYPEGSDAQYVTYRDLEVVVYAEYGGTTDTDSGELNSGETVSIRGTGGPERVVRASLNGPPIVQIVSQFTIVFASQSGTREYLRNVGSPSYPQPIWPDLERVSQRTLNREDTPSRIVLSYTYNFESPFPL